MFGILALAQYRVVRTHGPFYTLFGKRGMKTESNQRVGEKIEKWLFHHGKSKKDDEKN